jgi:hypothetical protein
LKLLPVQKRQLLEDLLTMRSQLDQDFAPVVLAVAAQNSATFDQTIDQFHCAVMAETQTFRQSFDCRTSASRQTFQGQQKLVLLRLNAVQARRLFAELQKLADMMPELG